MGTNLCGDEWGYWRTSVPMQLSNRYQLHAYTDTIHTRSRVLLGIV